MINAVLFIDTETIDESLHRLLEHSGESLQYRIGGIVVLRPPSGIRDTIKRSLWNLIAAIDGLAVFSSRQFRPYLRTRALSEYNIISHKIRLSNPAITTSLITELQPDILLWTAKDPPASALQSTAPLGILALRPHAEGGRPEGPPGFTEALRQQKSAGFSILHWNNAHSDPRVVVSGKIPVSPFCSVNSIALREKGFAFLQRALERIARNIEPPFRESVAAAQALSWRSAPNVTSQLSYLFTRLLPSAARMAYDRSAGRYVQKKAQRWNVAYQFTDKWQSADLRQSTIIKNPARHYLADPVVWSENGRHVCFVEDFDYDTMKGTITGYELTTEGSIPLGTLLEEPFHLSFPFIFQWDGQTWMCPDTHEAGEIRLYRPNSFPTGWRYSKTIMKGITATDTMLVEHEGRWWMLTNIDTSTLDERCSELHLFHADRPDSERWTPHPGNPVIFNSEQARNGGLIKDGGKLYRVFQVHGFNQYGESMGVAEITLLTPSAYEENIIAAISPDLFPGCLGTHTLSCSNGVLALDILSQEKLSG